MKYVFLLLFVCNLLAANGKNFNKANTGGKIMPVSHLLTAKNKKLLNSFVTINKLLQSDTASNAVLAYTKMMRAVDVYYFPGTSHKNALVIGGVHGSELSAIEVAKQVVKNLQAGEKPYYNTIVIPCLFPDNAAIAQSYPAEIGSIKNIGRYTNETTADPNRQMPALGTFFDDNKGTDMVGRSIEMENQLLLQLIQLFKPERIASLHAIRNTVSAGVYADPRTDCHSIALGYETDSVLAVQMAFQIQSSGGIAPGNMLNIKPTALYYCDPKVAKAGEKQPRNTHGSQLAGNKGYGVSLGSWASTSVCNEEEMNTRDAAILLTIEFPGNKRPQDYAGKEQAACRRNVKAYASAVNDVFLQQQNLIVKK